MTVKDVTKRQAEIIFQHFLLISRLKAQSPDPANCIKLRLKASENNGISEKNLLLYESTYRNESFRALKPCKSIIEPDRTPISRIQGCFRQGNPAQVKSFHRRC